MPSKDSGIYVVAVFALFMLLHTSDQFVIAPLLDQIKEEFMLSLAELGAIGTGTIAVAVLFYPLWGYLYDRFSRPRVISLAGAIWSLTTITSAFSLNFPQLLATRAATGIDNSSYAGMESLAGDYFPPAKRAKALGVMTGAGTAGNLLGLFMAILIGGIYGWRVAFMVTAGPGAVLALIILLTIRDRPRGRAEPEYEALKEVPRKEFSWGTVARLVRKRSYVGLAVQGFFGVFPWTILGFWIFFYLQSVRELASEVAGLLLAIWIVAVVFGNIASGYISDIAYRRSLRGRLLFGGAAVLLGNLLFYLTIRTPKPEVFNFAALGLITAFIIPMAGPVVISSVQDVAEPEIRSTALSLIRISENAGSSVAPLLVGIVGDAIGLELAMLWVVIPTWTICGLILLASAYWVKGDILALKELLRARARESALRPEA